MQKIVATSANIDVVLTQLGSLRASDDPVSSVVQESRGTLNCCKTASMVYVGHFAVPDNGSGVRHKKITACRCCLQMRVDDNGKFVKGSLRDYLTKLVKKHTRVDIFIENEAALGQFAPANR